MTQTTAVGRWKIGLAAVLLAITALNLRLLLLGSSYAEAGYSDFTAFYTAGKILQRGQAENLYDLRLQWRTQQEFARSVQIRVGPLPYIRPPFHSILFLPLSYLQYRTAYLVWMAVKVILLMLVPFLLRPYLVSSGIFTPWLAILFSFATIPVAVDLLQGQDAILFLVVCVLSYVSAVRGSEFLSGIFFGIGLFKFNLIFPIVLILALRKKGRMLQGFTLAAIVLLLISAWLVGWEGVKQYPIYLWHISQTPGTGVVMPANMPNIRGLLTFLSFVYVSAAFQNVVYVLLAVFGLCLTAWLWKDARHSDRFFWLEFSLALSMSLLLSPYCSGYDSTMLLLATFLLAGHGINEQLLPAKWKLCLFLSLGVLFFVPVSWGYARLWAIPLVLLVTVLVHWFKNACENLPVNAAVVR
ncbi:MAG TPA: glycosyltransferase family 87 protein [Terriglobales bacterium]|nr:glycosyltransferase family 87 protein [Terriglobales bacterium]